MLPLVGGRAEGERHASYRRLVRVFFFLILDGDNNDGGGRSGFRGALSGSAWAKWPVVTLSKSLFYYGGRGSGEGCVAPDDVFPWPLLLMLKVLRC